MNGGGGVFATLDDGTSLTLQNSVLSGNFAEGSKGGGLSVYFNSGGELVISNSVIKDNKSFDSGGGIVIECNGLTVSPTSFTLHNSAIIGNQSGFQEFDHHIVSSTGDGGGIVVGISSRVDNVLVESTTIAQNVARYDGGGITILGGEDGAQIVNSTVSSNRARSGGGLYMQGNVQVRHSTITGNVAGPFGTPAYSGGGGVLIRVSDADLSGPRPSFNHSIIAGNQHWQNDPGGNQGHDLTPDVGIILPIASGVGWPHEYFPPFAMAVPNKSVTSLTFDYTIVGDPAGPLTDRIADPGNPLATLVTPIGIGVAQLFGVYLQLGPLADNGAWLMLPDGSKLQTHAIDPTSPAYNAGGTGSFPQFDERGFPYVRVAFGRIDIGAYEYQTIIPPPCPPGDYNDNGIVDLADYIVWRHNLNFNVFLPNDVTPGHVDQSDYDVWRAHYGETCPQARSTSNIAQFEDPQTFNDALLMPNLATSFSQGHVMAGSQYTAKNPATDFGLLAVWALASDTRARTFDTIDAYFDAISRGPKSVSNETASYRLIDPNNMKAYVPITASLHSVLLS